MTFFFFLLNLKYTVYEKLKFIWNVKYICMYSKYKVIFPIHEIRIISIGLPKPKS